MTIDDLVTIFETAKGAGPEWVSGDDAVAAVRNLRRDKIAAVVRALRDEMSGNWIDCACCHQNAKLFTHILGDAGDGTVAGGHAKSVPEEVESFSQTPATDPAPAVCESEHEVNPHRPTYCPSCGLELDDLELDLLAAKRWRPRNE